MHKSLYLKNDKLQAVLPIFFVFLPKKFAPRGKSPSEGKNRAAERSGSGRFPPGVSALTVMPVKSAARTQSLTKAALSQEFFFYFFHFLLKF